MNQRYQINPTFSQPVNRASINQPVYVPEISGFPAQYATFISQQQYYPGFPQMSIPQQQILYPQPIPGNHSFQYIVNPQSAVTVSPDRILFPQFQASSYPATSQQIEILQPQTSTVPLPPKFKADPKINHKVQPVANIQQLPQSSINPNQALQNVQVISPPTSLQQIQSLQALHSVQQNPQISSIPQVPIQTQISAPPGVQLSGYPIMAPPVFMQPIISQRADQPQGIVKQIPQQAVQIKQPPPEINEHPNQVQPEEQMHLDLKTEQSLTDFLKNQQSPGIYNVISRGDLPSITFVSQNGK